MHVRFIMIGALMLMSSSAFAAEPAKTPPQPAAKTQTAPAQTVLASADSGPSPVSADQQAPSAPKRRIARVTTCRCGDPQVQSQQ